MTDKQATNTMVDSSSKGTTCQAQSKAEVSARSRVVNDSWVKGWLTPRGQYASLYRVILEGLTMHACRYETVSTRTHSGAIILSKLDVPQGHHALDIIAVGLVTSLLDRLPSRGKYKKVIRCDIWTCHLLCKKPALHLSVRKTQEAERYFKFHTSVIFPIPWISWIHYSLLLFF